MGGGGGDTKTSGALPWWAEGAHKTLIDKAENFAYGDRGDWIPYPDARIAGFTDEELASQQARRDLFDAGDPSGQFAAEQFSMGSNMAGGIADYAGREFTTDEMNRRMSPYMEGVINPQLREVRESFDRRLNQSQADSVARGGSIGSYRVGMEDTALRGERAMALGDVRAAGQQSAYETALRSFDADRQAGIAGLTAAGGLYGDIGTRAQNLGTASQQNELQRISELERAGVVQREMTQSEMNLAFQDFLEERDFPMRNMQFMSGILAGVPSGIGTTTTQTPNADLPSQLASLGIGSAGIAQLYEGFYGNDQ